MRKVKKNISEDQLKEAGVIIKKKPSFIPRKAETKTVEIEFIEFPKRKPTLKQQHMKFIVCYKAVDGYKTAFAGWDPKRACFVEWHWKLDKDERKKTPCNKLELDIRSFAVAPQPFIPEVK